MSAIPAELIAAFRVEAQRRLDRLEAAWLALGQDGGDRDLARQMARELHTLKGDAYMFGFRDAGLLCHKLEELLAAAERVRFAIAEELDLAVTMSIGFLGMLIRRKGDAPVGGIDLPGFIHHVDEVLADAAAGAAAPILTPGTAAGARPDDRDALSARTRDELAVIATELFIASLATGGAVRDRLHATWAALIAQLNRLRAMPIDRRLVRHAHAARLLAGDLGREITVELAVGDELIGVHALDALDAALGHAVRNAIDHGLRPPAERRARGQPPGGTLRIASRVTDDRVEVTVADDGAGIDLAAVEARARERRLIPNGAALDPDALLELLFLPGFSTLAQAGPHSGRGIGLDAARAALRAEGGDVAIATGPAGTTVTMRVPHQEPGLDVWCLGGDVPIAVPCEWTVVPIDGAIAGVPVLALDGVPVRGDVLVSRGGERAIIPGAIPPVRGYAVRVCPTPGTQPIEIVRIGDQHGVLIRPGAITAPRDVRPARIVRSPRAPFDGPVDSG